MAIVVSALLSAGMVAAGIGPAAAADPSGTIPLTSGDSQFGAERRLVGASAQGLVYTDASSSTVWVKPTGEAAAVLPGFGMGGNVDVTGDLIVGWDYTSGSIRYQSIDGTVSGSGTYDPLTEGVLGASATGWVLRNQDPTTIVHVNATTKSVTTLAAPPPGEGWVYPFVGPMGVAFSYYELASDQPAVSYTSLAAPATTTVIGSCDTLDCRIELNDVDGSAVVWLEELDSGGGNIVRQPLTGTGTTRIPLPSGANPTSGRMTGTHFAIVGCNTSSSVYTVPLAGGEWTQATGTISGLLNCAFASDGSQFLFSTTTEATAGQAGIYGLAPPGTSLAEIVATGAKPIAARAVAVSAGRASWVDDEQTDKPLWNRSLSGSGNGMTSGAKSLVATHATSFGLSISGRRTVFTREDGTGGMVTGGGAATTVDDGVAWYTRNPLQISGTRVLARRDFNTWRIHDLAGGGATDLVGTDDLQLRDAHLWGDTLAFSTANWAAGTGTVSVRNLLTGNDTVVAGPTVLEDEDNLSPANPSNTSALGEHISAWGDYVAWDEITVRLVDPTCDSAAGYCDTVSDTVMKYRDFRHMGPVRSLIVDASVQLADVAVTSSQVVLAGQTRDDAGFSISLRGASLGSETTTALADLPMQCCMGGLGRQLSIDGTKVAWLDRNSLPKVMSWGPDTGRPRFLGNGIAPTSVNTSNNVWNGEWVFSKPLPTCAVSIKSGGTTVRTLSCVTTDGSAVVAWDGKDGSGAAVPDGSYTWAINAADGTGAAFDVDGTTNAITGPIELHVPPGGHTSRPDPAEPSGSAGSACPHCPCPFWHRDHGKSQHHIADLGSPVTLAGALSRSGGSPLAAASVSVQSQVPGATSWNALTSVATSATGSWRATFKPAANRSYRAVYAGSANMLPTTSGVVAVTVRSKVTLGLSKAKVRLGAHMTFSGVVTPNHKGSRVSLQRLQGHKWVTKKTAKLTSRSKFSVAWTTNSTKDFSWRVIVPKYKDHAAGASPNRRLTVV